jgi:hypothetical protein
MHHPASPQHSQHCVMEAGGACFGQSIYLQMAQLHQVPDLRRDGAVDGVLAHVTATHPPMSAPRLLGAGWRAQMRSMNSQFSELSQHPNLRRDGAVDVVIVHVTATHPAMSAQVCWKMGGGWVWATYKWRSSTKFPTSVGMEPLIWLSLTSLPHIHPCQHHVSWALGGGRRCGR